MNDLKMLCKSQNTVTKHLPSLEEINAFRKSHPSVSYAEVFDKNAGAKATVEQAQTIKKSAEPSTDAVAKLAQRLRAIKR